MRHTAIHAKVAGASTGLSGVLTGQRVPRGRNESISLDGTGIETLHYDEVMRTSNGTSDYADFVINSDG